MAIPEEPLPSIEPIRVKATRIQLGIARAERQPVSELSFSVRRETVASLRAGTLILLEMERIGNPNLLCSDGDRLAVGFDAAIGCIVGGNPQPFPSAFRNQQLMVVQSGQVIEPTENARPGQVAHVSVR